MTRVRRRRRLRRSAGTGAVTRVVPLSPAEKSGTARPQVCGRPQSCLQIALALAHAAGDPGTTLTAITVYDLPLLQADVNRRASADLLGSDPAPYQPGRLSVSLTPTAPAASSQRPYAPDSPRRLLRPPQPPGHRRPRNPYNHPPQGHRTGLSDSHRTRRRIQSVWAYRTRLFT